MHRQRVSAANLIHAILEYPAPDVGMEDLEPIIKKALEINKIEISAFDEFCDYINRKRLDINFLIRTIEKYETKEGQYVLG